MTHLTDYTIRAMMEAATEGPWFLDGGTMFTKKQNGENAWQASFSQDGRHQTSFDEVLASAALSQAAPDLAAECLSRGAERDALKSVIEQLQGPLTVAALVARAETAKAERDAALARVKELEGAIRSILDADVSPKPLRAAIITARLGAIRKSLENRNE